MAEQRKVSCEVMRASGEGQSAAARAGGMTAEAPPADVAAAPVVNGTDQVALPLGRRFTALQPRVVIFGALLLFAVLATAIWLFDRLTHIVITDARISTNMVLVSSRVPGWIESIAVQEGQQVNKGDVLIHMDSRDAAFRLAEAKAELNRVEAQVAGARASKAMVDGTTSSRVDAQRSRLDALTSAVASAGADYEMIQTELKRAHAMRDQRLLSEREFDERRTAAARAEQSLIQAEAELQAARASLVETEAARTELEIKDDDLQVLIEERSRLVAVRDRLEATLADHQIKAALSGVIDESFVNAGEFVQPGQRMLVMHNPEDLSVKANVKETDIRYLQVGELVEVSVDAFPGETLTGTVGRIGESATSQFSLLPNANPSGNFTKITQRIEVRIDLPKNELDLRPGMMVEVRADQ